MGGINNFMLEKVVKLGLIGSNGRMGKSILEEIYSYSQLRLSSIYLRINELPHINLKREVKIFSNYPDLFNESDVIIDFSSVTTIEEYSKEKKELFKPMVIGTTGLNNSQKSKILRISKNVPIVYSENMSITHNILLNLVKYLSSLMDNSFDVELMDIHHRYKLDSPSGTALALANAVKEGRKLRLFDKSNSKEEKNIEIIINRSGIRKGNSIGVTSQRGGTIIGEHLINFLGDEENLRISHNISSRKVFSRGAVMAAIWVSKKKEPGLYSMRDVLEIRNNK